MNTISFFPEENQNLLIEKDILSVYQVKNTGRREIKQEMSPAEIAENVSNFLIDMVKKDFQKLATK
jgi:hypothetical protein